MSPHHAILFDLDGTLIDSEPWHRKAEIETYAEFGFVPTDEELLESVGIPMSATIERLAERHRLAMTPDAFRERHQPRLSQHVANDLEMFPDVEGAMRQLEGRVLGLVTSSESWYVEAVLSRFGSVLSEFRVVVTSDNVTKGKPDPAPFLIAAERLGVTPDQCLAVEDSPNGLTSAMAAGCEVVRIRRPNRVFTTPKGVGTIDSLLDLLTRRKGSN